MKNCDSDEKFDIRNSEYLDYLITRGYSPILVKINKWINKKQFYFVRNMSISDFIQNEPNSYKFNVNLVAVYNPITKSLHYKLPSKLTCLYCIITLKWNIYILSMLHVKEVKA